MESAGRFVLCEKRFALPAGSVQEQEAHAEEEDEVHPDGDDEHAGVAAGSPAFAGEFGFHAQQAREVPAQPPAADEGEDEAKATENTEDVEGRLTDCWIVHDGNTMA